MGSFDANTDFREGLDHRGGIVSVKGTRVLFEVSQHTLVDNVDINKDARLGAVDHALFKVTQVTRPSRAGVDHCGDTAAEGVGIGIHAQSFRVAFRRACVIDMDMNVENARGDNVSADIDDICCQCRVDVVRHRRNLVALDCHIPHCIYAVVRVDNVSTLEQEVVRFCTCFQRHVC